MEDTPPGQEVAAESAVVALGGDSNLPEAPTFVGAHSQNGGVADAPSPTPPLACLSPPTDLLNSERTTEPKHGTQHRDSGGVLASKALLNLHSSHSGHFTAGPYLT